jgi:hypothetical protein
MIPSGNERSAPLQHPIAPSGEMKGDTITVSKIDMSGKKK